MTAEKKRGAAGASTFPSIIFEGYDTFSGRPRSTAVTGSTASTGSRVRTEFQVCETMARLEKHLDISVDASASFAFGSGDAKGRFIEQKEINSTHIVISIYASNTQSIAATNVTFSNDVAPPATDAACKDFIRAYGDSYVSSLTRGGEYIALYVFDTHSEEHRTKVLGEIKAKFKGLGGSYSADVQAEINDCCTSTSTSWRFEQILIGYQGIAPPRPNPKEQDQISNFLTDLFKAPANDPQVTSFGTTGYEHVPKMPETQNWAQIRDNAEVFLPSLYDIANPLRTALQQAETISAVYRGYNYAGDRQLVDRKAQLRMDADALKTLVRQVAGAPWSSFVKPQLVSMSWGVPELSFKLSKPDEGYIGAPAQQGGLPAFNDVEARDIYQGIRLNTVNLGTVVTGSTPKARMVGKIECTYLYCSTDRDPETMSHGDKNCTDVRKLTVGPHIPVAEISGWMMVHPDQSSGVLSELGMKTSSGEEARAGGKLPLPDQFSRWKTWQSPAGSVVVGFHGCANDSAVAGVGPVVCTLGPAQWWQQD
ncbi:hypothetical protein AB0C21_32225 [Spirillospora sp. NPDC049024]